MENHSSGISIELTGIKSDGSLIVEIYNKGDDTIRLWKYANSWGWHNWRILVIRGSNTFLIQRNPNEGFTRNFPNYKELAATQKATEILNMNDGDWYCNNKEGFNLKKGDEIVVFYGIEETPESKTCNVWTGKLITYYKYP